MTTLQQVTASDQTLARLNENFGSVSPAGLYARNPATTAGLTLGYYGGFFGGNTVADGTIALDDSEAAVYVVAARSDGTVSQSTGTTNWNDSTNYFRIGLAVTGATTITTWTDYREAYAAPVGGGGGGAVSSVNGQTGAVVLELGDLDDVNAPTPADGDVLTWDNTAGEWVADAPAGGGAVASVNGATGVVVLDAGDIGITDAGGYFTGTDSEAALQELGASRAAISETIDDRVAALLVAGTNITLTYNDGAGTLTIDATGGAAGGINAQTGTTYTGVLSDAGKTITMANAASNVLTVPPNSSVAYPVGAQIGVMMNGAGQTSVAPGAGVTINTIETLLLLKQGAVAVLEQTATDVWRLTGELRPFIPVYRSKQRFDPANSTTVGTVQGVAFTSAGTVSHQALSTSSIQSVLRRTRWATAASAGNAAGIYETAVTKVRGNAAGVGGFYAEIVFDQATNVNGHQAFIGLAASVAALGGEPSALVNMIGMGYDSTDGSTGNWQLMRNDGSGTATKVDLGTGAARNTTDVYVLTIRSPQNGSVIFVTVVNLTTGVTVLDTSYSTDLPGNTVFLALRANIRTGATTTIGLLEVATMDVGYQE